MAGPRQPIELIVANGRKHLTKSEINERRESEPEHCSDNIKAPGYLTSAQKKHFDVIAGQLTRINLMGETDSETVARYVIAEEDYEKAVKDLREARRKKPDGDSLEDLLLWQECLNVVDKRIDRYFKQAHTAASALGLTISSRCKLCIPKAAEPPKENKFAKFNREEASG